MGSDATMVNASAPAISKDLGKKKKNNRSAKLKQCKLDARREQWLSQVKNKSCKITSDNMNSPSPYPVSRVANQEDSWGDSIKIRPKKDDRVVQEDLHDSDMESLFSSPTSTSSGTSYSTKNCLTENESSRSSSSGSYFRSVNEDKGDDDDDVDDNEVEENEGGGDSGFDDWEVVADALTTSSLTTSSDPQNHPKSETNAIPIIPSANTQHNRSMNISRDNGILKKPDSNSRLLRAWRPDDASRPQTLPSLSKQNSFPINMEQKYIERMNWSNEGFVNQQSSCPICYEDLDLTDSSFCPCSCGFHICLFCHKRILEADGRCPACRKQYRPVAGVETTASGGTTALSFRMSRSCSMNSRY